MVNLRSRVSFSIPNELLRSIDELARVKRVNRSALLAESVKLGGRELRIRFALEQYERGSISVGRAAEMAEVSLAELLEEMHKRGIIPRYNLDFLVKESIENDGNYGSKYPDNAAEA
jgi:predicted HTH domain antitoxin